MKIAVIICEYNPLQNGHLYHMDITKKQTNCDRLVCIMSGNFVQRGQASIVDKYTRAEWAIKAGADAVAELNPEYVLTTAKYFALGAIKIANALKADKILSFGSEIGDENLLLKAVNFEENAQFKSLFASLIKSGQGYAESYHSALKSLAPDLADALALPNNILGVEYLKAIKDTNSDIKPFTIKRIGQYNDTTPNQGFASASAIRQMLAENNYDDIAKYTPYYVAEYLSRLSKNHQSLASQKLFSILKYSFDKIKAQKAHGVKEGIENRIEDCLINSNDFESFLDMLATKRYTNAYLLRTIANILIANNFDSIALTQKPIDYVNILAVKNNSKDILSCFDCQVISKNSALPKDSLILKADRLYSSIYGNIDNGMKIVNL